MFYTETKDQRPFVNDAAKKIDTILEKQAADIFRSVLGCEMLHLKRIACIVEKKLVENGAK